MSNNALRLYTVVTYRADGASHSGSHLDYRTHSAFEISLEETREHAVAALAHAYFLGGTEVRTYRTPYGDRQSHVFVNSAGIDSDAGTDDLQEEYAELRALSAEARSIAAEAHEVADKRLAEKKAKDTAEEERKKAADASEERARDLRQLEALKQKLGTA